MANRFLTRQGFMDGLMASCRRTADSLTDSEARKFADSQVPNALGINAGIYVGLIVACQERIARQEYEQAYNYVFACRFAEGAD